MKETAVSELCDIFERERVDFTSNDMTRRNKDRLANLLFSLGADGVHFVDEPWVTIDDEEYLAESFPITEDTKSDENIFKGAYIYLYSVSIEQYAAFDRYALLRLVEDEKYELMKLKDKK